MILYFKEKPDRKARKHYEAWQVIDAASGVKTSYARIKALEDLNRDGVTLKGLDLSLADLRGINLRDAVLIDVDLRGAYLFKADLRGAKFYAVKLSPLHLGTLKDPDNLEDLGNPHKGDEYASSDLCEANLSGASFEYTNFTGARFYNTQAEYAHFRETQLISANLYQAIFTGSTFNSVYLAGASLVETDLRGTKGLTRLELIRANLCRTKLPEDIDLNPNRNCLDE